MHSDNKHTRHERKPALQRRLGFWLLSFYGLGNILGAGIYVLVGQVAGLAGLYAPLSFLLAAIVASFTALTYAELSSRFPVSAGEAVYIQEGFGFKGLSVGVGLAIAAAGMLSAATITRGFAGYAQVFFTVPETTLIIGLIVGLAAVASWGIAESVKLAALFTLLEISGLLLIIFVGAPQLERLPDLLHAAPPLTSLTVWPGIFLGAFLAFYAFIGFEDMVNVAEEVRNPQKNMPRAIILALLTATLLYGGVAVVAITNLTPEHLTASNAPLSDLYTEATGRSPTLITIISMFAVVNGALIQVIMAARIFYGMASRGWLPKILSKVHPRTHTPVIATLFVSGTILALALWFPLVRLAELTSYLILLIFIMVNLALLKIRRRPAAENIRVYPAWVPIFGAVGAITLLLGQLFLE